MRNGGLWKPAPCSPKFPHEQNRTKKRGLLPAMSTASDKDQFARVLAIISAIVSILAIVVSSYFAWKQYNLSEKVYDVQEKVLSQSQENLALSAMLDWGAPIHLISPQKIMEPDVPNATAQSPPTITARYNALLSNRSLITIGIKSYQVACDQHGQLSTHFGKLADSLFTSDDENLKKSTSIDAGKSISFYVQSTCEISLDAFNLLKAKPMQSLAAANSILGDHYTNFFGQVPKVQKGPYGSEMLSFTREGYPSIYVSITTTRDGKFSWDFLWEGIP
jgi:hypothetical protein